MRRPRVSPHGLCVSLSLVLLIGLVSAAEPWSTNPAVNTPVCTLQGIQLNQDAATDGAAGTIVVWEDARGLDRDLYAQRFDVYGAALWTSNGVLVCGAAADQIQPRIVSDGSGGAVVVWTDRRGAGAELDVYAQRIGPDGFRLWASDGVAVCTAVHDQTEIDVVPDGTGGVYVIWTDYRGTTQPDPNKARTYVQHVLATGLSAWAANGLRIGSTLEGFLEPRIAPVPNEGVYAVLSRPSMELRSYRIDADGSMPWSTAGVDPRGTGESPRDARIVSDGNNGAIVSWVQSPSHSSVNEIRVQRLARDGTKRWGNAGFIARSVASPVREPVTLPDGIGGVILAWRDQRNDLGDIYAQRVDSLGTPIWTANGVAVAASSPAQGHPNLASDAQGGWFVVWEDSSTGLADLSVQRVLGNGTILGPTAGIPLANAPDKQESPTIATDGSYGGVVFWTDARTPANARDLYASRVGPLPALGDPPRVTSVVPPQAEAGTPVSVFGSGFTGTTLVRFGNVSSPFVIVSDGEIGTTASSCGLVTVQASSGLSIGGPILESSPQVSGLSPNAATVQTSIRITGDCFLGTTGVQFNGSPSTNFVVHSAQEIVAVVPGGATSGPVTVTNAAGAGSSAGFFTVLPQLTELSGCFFVPPFPGYSADSNPSDLVLADLNQDQRLDLIVAHTGAGTVTLRAGAGDGSFGAATSYAAGSNPNALAVADFNGDARPDLLVGNGSIQTVSLLLGQPGGSFSPAQSYPAGGPIADVLAADLDGNGTTDAVVLLGGNVPDEVRALPGNGAGQLFAAQPLQDIGDGLDMEATDLDGNGRLDLLVIESGSVQRLMNQGGFVFTKPGPRSVNGVSALQAISLADVTQDGRLDVVVAGSTPPRIGFLRSNGDGNLDPLPPADLPSGALPADIVVADVNLDGRPDLAAPDAAGGRLDLLLCRSGTSYEPALIYSSAMMSPSRLAGGDLDRDGRPDFVALSPTLGMASAVLNFGANDLFCPPVATYPADGGPRDLVSLDYNLDGVADIAAADSTGRSIDLWPGSVDGTFGAAVTRGLMDSGPTAIATGDFDGDGDLDLATSGVGGRLEVQRANGVGGFTGQTSSPTNADDGLAVGRLNTDAIIDAVVAKHAIGGDLSIMTGDGDATFTRTVLDLGTSPDPRRPALGDLDHDNDLDLVVADYELGGVRILPGNGNGTFGAATFRSTGSRANFVALADVDGDQKLDVVVTHAVASNLSVLPGLGNGTFGTRRDFPALSGARSVALGDVNGDGWLDAVTCHPAAGKVSLFLNTRDGGFQPRKDFNYFGSPVAALIRDLNGDFKNDLAVVETNHNRLTVILNRGDFQAGTWLGGGIALGPGSGQRFFPVQAPDGAGGSVVGWRELRGTGEFDPYVQRLTSSGTLAAGWPVNGRAITNAVGNQYVNGIASDGHFGALVAWADGRDSLAIPGRGLDIYVQRADSASTLRWAPNGVALCTANADQNRPLLVGDGQGGGIAVWSDSRNGIPDYFAQRVDATGTPLWAVNGVPVSNAPAIRDQATMVSDGAGGAFLAWTEGTGSGRNILGQHFDPGGATLWGPGGIVICGAPGAQSEPESFVDPYGNFIVAWTDERNGPADLYWQRVDAAGIPSWQPDGMPGVPESGEQRQATMVSDGFRGGIIGWTDTRSGSEDVYATRFDENGQIADGWPAGGVPVATVAQDQFAPEAVTDGENGAIFFWRDERNGNLDLFAQRIASYGLPAPGWTFDGVAVCDVLGEQTVQSAVSDGDHGAIAVWQDSRSDSTTIFAARIDGSGDAQPVDVANPRRTAGGVRFAGPWPNPAAGNARFVVDLDASGMVMLEIFDVAGRRVRRIAPPEPLVAGRHVLAWDGRSDTGGQVASGIFFARLRVDKNVLTRRCVLLR